MDKIEYVRCPRCELNYIDKREKMCKVCEQELQAKGNRELTDEEVKELNLCPICRTNYLIDEEEICSECAAEKAAFENNEGLNLTDDEQADEKDEREDNWRAYVENDDAEVPEDEFGDMTSITSEDEDMIDEDLEDMDKDEDFEDDFEEENEEDDFEDDFESDFESDFDDSYDDEEYDEEDDDDDDDDDDF